MKRTVLAHKFQLRPDKADLASRKRLLTGIAVLFNLLALATDGRHRLRSR